MNSKKHVAWAMKAGFEDRWSAYKEAIEMGVLLPSEVREMELIVRTVPEPALAR